MRESSFVICVVGALRLPGETETFASREASLNKTIFINEFIAPSYYGYMDVGDSALFFKEFGKWEKVGKTWS